LQEASKFAVSTPSVHSKGSRVNKIKRQRPENRTKTAQSGFTLAEIVVVLTVVGIMLAIGLIKITKGQRASQIHAAAAQLLADLEFAQETAIATGREVSVHLDLENNRYYLTWADGTFLRTPAGNRPFVVYFGMGRFKSVHLLGCQLNGHVLRFRPNGHPMDSGGSLSSERLVANLNNRYAVYVQPVTGSIRMARLEQDND